jgi:hypothetical protein
VRENFPNAWLSGLQQKMKVWVPPRLSSLNATQVDTDKIFLCRLMTAQTGNKQQSIKGR